MKSALKRFDLLHGLFDDILRQAKYLGYQIAVFFDQPQYRID
jgi:hypothetical protein